MSAPCAPGRIEAALLFLDVESSGLGEDSYPIEVALCDDALSLRSWLVRPEPGWTSWSVLAESLHGMGRDAVCRDGEPAAAVAHAMSAAAGDGWVASDAPEADGAWVDRLYAAAGLERPFRIVDVGEALLGLGVPVEAAVARARAWDRARAAAARRFPHVHRAGPDALALAAAWRAAADPSFLALMEAGPLTDAGRGCIYGRVEGALA